MHRRVTAGAVAALLVLLASHANAQPSATPTSDRAAGSAASSSAAPGAPAVSTTSESTTAVAPDPTAGQEIGVRLGLAGGGRVTPGGLYLAGTYLYRLAEVDWFEIGIAFSFGGGDTTCFRDRDNAMICDQGNLSGFAGEVSAGVRRYFLGRGILTPYARFGISLRFVNFEDDKLKGLALPLWIGGGARARVANGVHVVGDASLHAGPAVMGKRLGLEPQLAVIVFGGVEFRLD